uniref:F-box domain-containing protein n=1 Tax=Macrostomum lignano TaxID=282301 RepID=A0A1I8IQV8_9PLAT
PGPPLLDRLPPDCLARIAASLNLLELARVCKVSPAFRRLCGVVDVNIDSPTTDRGASDACWVERIRRHFGADYLRNCWAFVNKDTCCGRNPFARLYLHALLGLYRAQPEQLLLDGRAQEQQRSEAARLVPESSLTGALFPAPLLSPVFLGQPLSMDFSFVGVHPGRYDLLLRVKKLLCDPLDSESVASAADSSGVRVPLLQA